MDRRLGRWLRYGLPLGAIGAAAYAASRSRTEPSASEQREPSGNAQRIITERHGAAFLVGRRIDPGRVDAVTEHVVRTLTGSDSRRLLGLEGASTASLFLDRRGDEPELVWYVEVPRAVVSEWTDPDRTVADAFPIAHDALEEPTRPTDRSLLVHAANPTRPRTLAPSDSSAGETRSLAVAVDGTVPGIDVDLARMRLRPGLPERFADWFERVSRRVIDGDLDLGRIESRSAEMLDAERMYTESLVLERGEDGYACYLYMEAADMRAVYDAYYDTRNPVARVSEPLVGWLLENPECVLEYPLESAAELLAHAVNPNRPRRPDDRPERTQ
ncbi:hypothetical protein [Haloterrigena alkaliphila]|uniref:Uncharacterized protein n=1 Tax=Haloterrigena alkaliphila TaxID=2816475 RepID=A0A8A2VH73_9EURY|nr:hypothetical protein [Haloterrigena alkaliphila]QSW99682.1 hypothetical protein J0X25_01590 [Haloterrigena alkaliphila]